MTFGPADADTACMEAVLSPTGRLHAVRPGVHHTVCGWNVKRRKYTRGYATNGWTALGVPFDEARVQPRCGNCTTGIAANTGPGA